MAVQFVHEYLKEHEPRAARRPTPAVGGTKEAHDGDSAAGTGPAYVTAPYDGFDRMLVDGTWRHGAAGPGRRTATPTRTTSWSASPWRTSGTWTRRTAPPRRRRRLGRHGGPRNGPPSSGGTASIMEARREEIVDWLVRESGSTRIKAEIEWQFTRAMTLEAATFPSRPEGHILPTDVAGKESRVYRAAGRRGRHDQPVELPAAPQQPVHRPRAGAGQRGGDQAGVGHAGDRRAAARQDLRGGGLPPGVLNVVDRRRAATIGEQFVLHPVPRVISFTGSTEVGRHIMEQAARARSSRGWPSSWAGTRPRVILDDADLGPRGRHGRLRQVPPPGPDLHGDQPTDRRREGPRRVRRPLHRPGPRPEGRRPGR